MNAKQLRVAAEWLSHAASEYFEQYMIEDHDDPDSRGHFERIDRVTDHILATVRDDDDELLTSEWVRMVLPRYAWDDWPGYFPKQEFGMHLRLGKLNPRPATRGDFRQLCRLLGVTLKEGE